MAGNIPSAASDSLQAVRPALVTGSKITFSQVQVAAWLIDLGLSMPLELERRMRCARLHVEAGADVTPARKSLSLQVLHYHLWYVLATLWQDVCAASAFCGLHILQKVEQSACGMLTLPTSHAAC